MSRDLALYSLLGSIFITYINCIFVFVLFISKFFVNSFLQKVCTVQVNLLTVQFICHKFYEKRCKNNIKN